MTASSKDHPIISIVVNAPSKDANGRLQRALTELTRSDPTVRVRKCSEDGHFALEGWRVAQLQVICDRIRDEYEVAVGLGAPSAILVETVRDTAMGEGKYIRQTGG